MFLSSLFANISKATLTGVEIGEFAVSDYFDIKLGGNDEIEDLEEGTHPIVSTSEFMNGVTTWKKPNYLYPAPSITVATDGSVCSSFVQEFPYYAFYKVAILTPKKDKKIPIDAFYYIAYLLNRERWRYVYARKFGKGRISKTKIIAPVNKNGKPDFEKMAEIVKQTNAYSIIQFFRENAVIKQVAPSV